MFSVSLRVFTRAELIRMRVFFAALWRASGLPPKFGFDWVSDIRMSRDWSLPERAEATGWVSGLELEVGILNFPGIPTETVISAVGVKLARNRRVATIATPDGAYRLALPNGGTIWPVVFAPGISTDRSATGTLEETVAAFLALAVESEGGCGV